MNYIPAEPGTFYLLGRRSTETPGRFTVVQIPVIAWNNIQGSLAFPVCSVAIPGARKDAAILHPDGTVTSISRESVYAEMKFWVSDCSDDFPEETHPHRIRQGERSAKTPVANFDDVL